MPQQAPQSNPKVPLIATVSQRGASPTIDARLVNGIIEKFPDGTIWAVKRPGFSATIPAATGNALGIFFSQGAQVVFSAIGSNLYSTNTSVGTISAITGMYSFDEKITPVPQIFLHSTTKCYTYDTTLGLQEQAAAEALLTGSNTFAAGSAYLDGTLYLAVADAIYGCAINDFATWSALNVIHANMSPESIIVIFRHLEYVMVLKQASMEGFYDTGNATGSPLARAPGTFLNFGCKAANTFQKIENTCIWVASTAYGGVSVMTMNNLSPSIVSTPSVERMLQDADYTAVYSLGMRVGGHRLYVLTFVNSNFTLVYDLTEKEWYQWTDANGNYWPFVDTAITVTNDVFLQKTTGAVFLFDFDIYTDAGATITVDAYTSNWDGGTSLRKYLPRMDFHTDQNTTGTLLVRCSDDDYQRWTNFRSVDLSKKNPKLRDCGTFRKRAWHVRYTAPTPFRMKELELYPEIGTI